MSAEEVEEAREERDEAMDAVTDTEGGPAAYNVQTELAELEEELNLRATLQRDREDETKDMYLIAFGTNEYGRAIISEESSLDYMGGVAGGK